MADSKRKTANLFDGQLQQGYYTYHNGVYVLSDAYVCTHLIPCIENTTYTFRCINTGGGSKNYGYVFFDSSQNRIGDDYINGFTEGDVVIHTATTPQNTAFLAINIAYGRRQANVIRPSDITNFMLNTGSTALPYEPYGWVHSLRKLTTATDTFTTLPAFIYADGNNATVGISGNTVQNGTPIPDNPIMPQGTGERTGNLINIYANDTSNGYINNAMLLNSGNIYSPSYGFVSEYQPINESVTYTLNTGRQTGIGQSICFYTSNKQFISGVAYENKSVITFTTPQGARYFRCTVMRTQNDTESYKYTMLNLGSTALPYEPYGIKIPISSAGQTTPVYLGDVETTRRIKKLVLTGEENWILYALSGAVNVERFYMVLSQNAISRGNIIVSTHFPTETDNSDTEHIRCGGTSSNEMYIYISRLVATTSAELKSYLAAQYAAGTPVTVWYVLATEETAVVNEPLMKIGDYADEVSGITIPTVAGANTIDIDTTLKPSEVSVNYHGWHPVADVHERENGAWD